jgi:transposase
VQREAVALAAQGVSRRQIAAALDRSVHTVNKWLALARRQGPDALAAAPHPGRQPKLSVRPRQWLRRQRLNGAQAHGWSTDLWTAARVRELIWRKYGVEYHGCYVPTLLKALGWTRQKPERRARERNEAEIERWVRVEWPPATPRKFGPSGVSSTSTPPPERPRRRAPARISPEMKGAARRKSLRLKVHPAGLEPATFGSVVLRSPAGALRMPGRPMKTRGSLKGHFQPKPAKSTKVGTLFRPVPTFDRASV